MRYIVDHDFHIHSQLSTCSDDPNQTTERILRYGKENGFKAVAITDHFWSSKVPNNHPFYRIQDTERIKRSLPLPKADGIKFLFGCEADMDEKLTLGIHPSEYDDFDFIVVSTTHMHMFTDKKATAEERAKIYVKRFERLLESDLPFGCVGVAHLTCPHIFRGNWEDHIDVIDLIPDKLFSELFSEAEKLSLGIELNIPIFKYSEQELERILRPYIIAKECGCKFYLGGDAHHPDAFDKLKAAFEKIVDVLALKETDKFVL